MKPGKHKVQTPSIGCSPSLQVKISLVHAFGDSSPLRLVIFWTPCSSMGHGVQASSCSPPILSLYVLKSHLLHAVLPVIFCHWPSGHKVNVASPRVGLKVPGADSVHAVSTVCCSLSLYLPATLKWPDQEYARRKRRRQKQKWANTKKRKIFQTETNLPLSAIFRSLTRLISTLGTCNACCDCCLA